MSSGLGLKKLFNDTALNLCRQFFVIAIGILFSIIVNRGLGVEDKGIYVLALLLPKTLRALSNLGVRPATIYYTARNENELGTIIRSTVILSLLVSIAGVFVGVFISIFGGGQLFPGIPLKFLLISLIVFPLELFLLNLEGVLIGLEDFRKYNLIAMTPRWISLIIAVLLVWILPLGITGALIAIIAGNFIALLLAVGLLWNSFTSTKIWWDLHYGRQAVRYGIKAYFSNLIKYLNYRGDLFILNLISGSTSVGIYSVAATLGSQMWIFSQSISSVLYPRIASLHNDKQDKRRILTTLVAKNVFWFSIFLSIIVFFTAKWLIVKLYGIEFQEAAICLQWLLPGIILIGINRVIANDIAGRGKPELNSYQSAIALIINVVANIILIPKLQYVGAAIASTISYTSLTVMKIIVYCRLSGAKWYELWLFNPEDIALWQRLFKILNRRLIEKFS